MRSVPCSIAVLLLLLLAPADAQSRVPGKSWMRYASLAEAGFDETRLQNAKEIWERAPSSAFLVVHDGAVVAAWGDIERRFMCHSVRKSFLSALIGTHVDEGTIDEYKTLADLEIDDDEPGLSAEEKGARILDLLKARSGVYRLAAYEPPQNSKPARHSHRPGRFWCYNNWDFNTLLTIFEQETGTKIFENFNERFAIPLEMQDYRTRDGYYHYERDKSRHPAYPFRMSARDMARFGLLFLYEGLWGEQRILSRNWVRRSSVSYSKTFIGGYGFMWWTFEGSPFERYGTYAALGVGNQMIAVLPVLRLVLVNRANTFEGEGTPQSALYEIMESVVGARTGPASEKAKLVPLESEPDAARIVPATFRPDRVEGEFDYPSPRLGLPPRTRVSIRAEGERIIASSPISGTFEWLPQADGSFREEDSGRWYRLDRDESGRVVGVLDAVSLGRAALNQAETGDVARAVQSCEEACELFPESPDAHAYLGALKLLNDQAEEGVVQIQKVVARWPNFARSIENLINNEGYRQLQNDKASDAVHLFEANTRLFPQSSNVWDSLGEGYMNLKRYDEAIQMYEKSIELDPRNGNARTMIERMKEEQGKEKAGAGR